VGAGAPAGRVHPAPRLARESARGDRLVQFSRRATEDTCITAKDIPADEESPLGLPLDEPTPVTITTATAGTEQFQGSATGTGVGRLIVSG